MIDQAALEFLSTYLHERERIRLKKEAGEPAPWTEDKALANYKFTNLSRSHDRTTRWAIKNWYGPHRDRAYHNIVLNAAIYRYFGTTEFAEAIGWQEHYDGDFLKAKVVERQALKQRVWTSAYIIANGGETDIRLPKHEYVVDYYLTPFAKNATYDVGEVAEKTNSWEATCKEIRKHAGMGPFMSKEICLDLVLTPMLENCTDKLTWSPIGPGAMKGIRRLHREPTGSRTLTPTTEARELARLREIYTQLEKSNLFEDWMPKIGVEFGLTDLQFAMCEIDKYIRFHSGDGVPRNRYTPHKEPLP